MPRHLTDQLNRAQILYRQCDYTSALLAFTTILEKWPDKKNPPLHVLDQRVATLIKLRKYEDALKDATRMIKIDKTVSSGYLRAGQILRKLEQDKKALQIYELGLLSVTDPAAIAMLRKQSTEVKKDIVPDKAKDWLMTVLPYEILEMILGMLEFWEMVHLLRVCRTWKRVLTGMPRLWRNLDTVPPERSRRIKHKTLEIYAKRSQWAFTRLHLPASVACGTLRMLLAKGRSLEILKLRSVVSSQNKSTYVPPIMDSKSLRHLEIDDFYLGCSEIFKLIHALPSLVSIIVAVDRRAGDSHDLLNARIPARMQRVMFLDASGPYRLDDLLADATGLESLRLDGVDDGKMDIRHLGQLRVFHLEYEVVTGLMQFPACIERISLISSQENHHRPMLDLLENDRLQNLRHLKIFGDDTAIEELLRECGENIQDLGLEMISTSNYNYVMDRIRRRKFLALEKLTLKYLDTRDEDLGDVALGCPRLHTCQFLFQRYITGSGLRQMIDRCPRLKHITLETTPEISFDVVEWARSHGITVDYKAS